jgi:hypothetical protein
MLALLLIAETLARAVPAAPTEQARATVRISRSVSAGQAHWKDAPPERRREVVRKSADGRLERIRIVDYP